MKNPISANFSWVIPISLPMKFNRKFFKDGIEMRGANGDEEVISIPAPPCGHPY